MTTSAQARAAAERWFDDHGLPYFIDGTEVAVSAALSRRRLIPFSATVLVLAAGSGLVVGLLDDAEAGAWTGALVVLVAVACYGLTALRGARVTRWAARRTLTSLGLLFPLVTRALPLLLLFVTFLFINTEVWQVASSLDDGILWLAVLLFATVAITFLLVRLPEEVDRVDGRLTAEQLAALCVGTPLEEVAAERARTEPGRIESEPVVGLARSNLLLVLLVSQAVQVLLLALAVFAFFIVFGVVAIRPEIIESWTSHEPTWVLPDVHLISLELARVSVFLAAFSALYFTVYAVSDETYRSQFFTALTGELEQAVAVHGVYRAIAKASVDDMPEPDLE